MAQTPDEAREAERKAHALLLANLPDSERERLRRTGSFMVRGGISGAPYMLGGYGCFLSFPDASLRDSGDVLGSFCVNAYDETGCYLPPSDRMLALAMYIRHDEKRFIEEANFSNGYDRHYRRIREVLGAKELRYRGFEIL